MNVEKTKVMRISKTAMQIMIEPLVW